MNLGYNVKDKDILNLGRKITDYHIGVILNKGVLNQRDTMFFKTLCRHNSENFAMAWAILSNINE